jgi:hypothetical protein
MLSSLFASNSNLWGWHPASHLYAKHPEHGPL